MHRKIGAFLIPFVMFTSTLVYSAIWDQSTTLYSQKDNFGRYQHYGGFHTSHGECTASHVVLLFTRRNSLASCSYKYRTYSKTYLSSYNYYSVYGDGGGGLGINLTPFSSHKFSSCFRGEIQVIICIYSKKTKNKLSEDASVKLGLGEGGGRK